jgi:hypothetical protein
MSPLVSQIANFATPPVVAVLTAIITVQLSFRRFQAERWWDRKADAYSRIIEALHHAIAHASMASDECLTGYVEYSEEYRKRILDSYRKAQIDLEIATGVGAYVISDEAAKILKDLEHRPPQVDPLDTYGRLEADLKDYEKALDEIREIAKKDLKVR